jgi:hypothetical protein
VPTKRESDLFITRHAKTIYLVSFGGFLLGAIVFVICPSALQFSRALATNGPIRQFELRFAWLSFLGGMAIASAAGGAMIGLLPVFQRNITRLKRIVLFALCLLPGVFTLLNSVAASSEFGWQVIRCGIILSLPCWLLNGPAILTGRPFLQLGWGVMRALHLTSSDYAEWR